MTHGHGHGARCKSLGRYVVCTLPATEAARCACEDCNLAEWGEYQRVRQADQCARSAEIEQYQRGCEAAAVIESAATGTKKRPRSDGPGETETAQGAGGLLDGQSRGTMGT
eukprot:1341573-Rhodomonas_salina.1